MAQRVIDRAVQLFGGNGVRVGVKVEALYREIRALRIYEGATEVQKLIVAREVLKARDDRRAARRPSRNNAADRGTGTGSRHRARIRAQFLLPYSAEWDSQAVFPREALRELGKLGFMGMTVPVEWDGAGADYIAYALCAGGNRGWRRRRLDHHERP